MFKIHNFGSRVLVDELCQCFVGLGDAVDGLGIAVGYRVAVGSILGRQVRDHHLLIEILEHPDHFAEECRVVEQLLPHVPRELNLETGDPLFYRLLGHRMTVRPFGLVLVFVPIPLEFPVGRELARWKVGICKEIYLAAEETLSARNERVGIAPVLLDRLNPDVHEASGSVGLPMDVDVKQGLGGVLLHKRVQRLMELAAREHGLQEIIWIPIVIVDVGDISPHHEGIRSDAIDAHSMGELNGQCCSEFLPFVLPQCVPVFWSPPIDFFAVGSGEEHWPIDESKVMLLKVLALLNDAAFSENSETSNHGNGYQKGQTCLHDEGENCLVL